MRETFHHWIHTLQIPVHGDSLGEILPHQSAAHISSATPCHDPAYISRAKDILSDLEPDLKELIRQRRNDLSAAIATHLSADKDKALQEEEQRYQSRQGEVSTLIAENTLGKLEREIDRLKQMRDQGMLFEQEAFLDDIDRKIELKQEELQRRKLHYEEVRQQLAVERERVIKRMLPRSG